MPVCFGKMVGKHRECQTARLNTAFHPPPPAFHRAAGDSGKPGLVSVVPGGTITYENRNLFGNAASVAASINTKNFLAPADDLSFRVQYSQVGGAQQLGTAGPLCHTCKHSFEDTMQWRERAVAAWILLADRKATGGSSSSLCSQMKHR